MPSPSEALTQFLHHHPRLFVLTGAGCSTESGIPDYRDEHGQWKHRRPVEYGDFLRHHSVRRRYWARSSIGWNVIAQALPNPAHRALAVLEEYGFVHWLTTQNVDGLHQKAGSRRVLDLHGNLAEVECLSCRRRFSRARFQRRLEACNPTWESQALQIAPDGDVLLEEAMVESFQVPPCSHCGGIIKPGVTFFGEGVPRARAEQAFQRLEEADALLVVGSSLMIWSGFRFVRHAARTGLPTAAINLGKTRADDLLDLKITLPCGEVLSELVSHLNHETPSERLIPKSPPPS